MASFWNLTSASFQSTHLLRGATGKIKMHLQVVFNFNPRTSCEVRPMWTIIMPGRERFQSTHLLRGATQKLQMDLPPESDFNPRTSCEVRQMKNRAKYENGDFNPRTSCEVRPSTTTSAAEARLFQSTHLLRGATATTWSIPS